MPQSLTVALQMFKFFFKLMPQLLIAALLFMHYFEYYFHFQTILVNFFFSKKLNMSKTPFNTLTHQKSYQDTSFPSTKNSVDGNHSLFLQKAGRNES